jgi:arginyl-tRNA synthetase
MMLYRKNDAVLDFDLAKVIEQSREARYFTLIWACARPIDVPQCGRRGARPAADAGSRVALLAGGNRSLSDPAELSLMRGIASIRASWGRGYRPRTHRIAFICMVWPASFTRSGPREKTYSFTLHYPE